MIRIVHIRSRNSASYAAAASKLHKRGSESEVLGKFLCLPPVLQRPLTQQRPGLLVRPARS